MQGKEGPQAGFSCLPYTATPYPRWMSIWPVMLVSTG